MNLCIFVLCAYAKNAVLPKSSYTFELRILAENAE
jgi:hypothetical protein